MLMTVKIASRTLGTNVMFSFLAMIMGTAYKFPKRLQILRKQSILHETVIVRKTYCNSRRLVLPLNLPLHCDLFTNIAELKKIHHRHVLVQCKTATTS